ncbi:MAG: TFIIB-type zinc finger domain-containing protein [Eubacteriales bacterium]|nr:TFIIB-type zinc finger domain-containing protein [Eubacteriales bacterium]
MNDPKQKKQDTEFRPDEFICPECGCRMVFEDDGLLICPECGISMRVDEFES